MPSLQLPTTQGLNSSTWRQPDLSGASNLGDIFEHHARNSSSHLWAVWHDPTVPGDDKRGKMTYAIWWNAIQRASKFLMKHFDLPSNPIGPEDHCIIAIFATMDPLSYLVMIHAIIYLGYTAFPLSTRNSVDAVIHLLESSHCRRIVVAGGEPIQKVIRDANQQIGKRVAKSQGLWAVDAPKFGELFPEYGPSTSREAHRVTLTTRPRRPRMSDDALILHSSGSTGFPKSIHITHDSCIDWMRIPWYGERDVCGSVLGVPSLPPFHAMGLFAYSWLVLGSGVVVGVFDPTAAPKAPSPENVLAGLKGTGSDWTLVVPSFLEAWVNDPQAVTYLSTLEQLMYGGGPILAGVVEKLVANGVKAVVLYAATEFGSPHVFSPLQGQSEWLKFSTQNGHKLLPQDQDRLYELVMVARDHYCPSATDDLNSAEYATKDLIELHPENKALFRLVGRIDDQVMLSTGEKTNSGPIECIVCTSTMIERAVVFGWGKTQNGILVQPTKDNEIDLNDEGAVARFRSSVWDKVREANTFAPQHSHILKEMILVTSPNKPILLTAKNTVIRKAALALYEDEIEACYAAVDHSAEAARDIPVPTSWNQEETSIFIRRIVAKVMERDEPPTDEDDLFQNGLDSLRATYLRNSLLTVLRSACGERIARFPPDFVFAHPTIRSLTSSISSLASASRDAESLMAEDDLVLSHINAMEDAIRKYTSNLPSHRSDVITYPPPKHEQEVVLLTGSTGGLGSHLLEQLVQMDSVVKVYALNRKSSGISLAERQMNVLSDRLGNHEEALRIVRNPKLFLVEAVLEREDFGISEEVFEEIRTTTTLIIHNAWRLDFNLVLDSFTPQLKSVSTLVRLSLRSPHPSPPRILFTSSIATVSNWSSSVGPVPERPLDDLRVAVGNGYGESKAVAEKILEVVGRTTPLKSISFRIGQLAGSTPSGAWATSDWVPLIARGSQELGALPDGRGHITWLPVDVAASAILELRHSKNQTLHITHPRPVAWSLVMGCFSSLLGVPLVPFNEWLEKLESSTSKDAHAIQSNPALALMTFFKSMGASFKDGGEVLSNGDGVEAGGLPTLSLEKSRAGGRSLQRALGLTEGDVRRWVDYWRAKGFLREL
ncbi:hypothetical protein FRB94_013915 [Tulasnella sp. JGI-2019a]|nr:hypothetical protein FRB93_002388 [Tulasnella sp. JGI-2019a]KAG9007859.1 hypothetical protein FRB94_013915 [Tulasnella sp. JGI-2019a]